MLNRKPGLAEGRGGATANCTFAAKSRGLASEVCRGCAVLGACPHHRQANAGVLPLE